MLRQVDRLVDDIVSDAFDDGYNSCSDQIPWCPIAVTRNVETMAVEASVVSAMAMKPATEACVSVFRIARQILAGVMAAAVSAES